MKGHMLKICLAALGVPPPAMEYKFHPQRKWRVDYCWPDLRLAVEIEGGVWKYGRHNRAVSFLKDMEKYNALAMMGYRLLRFTPQDVQNGNAATAIADFINQRRMVIQ